MGDIPLADASDADLVLRCRAGEAIAWEAVVRRFKRLVYSVPVRMGLPSSDADDVFQETFASFLEHLGSIKDPARVGLWLAVTARRKALHRVTRGPRVKETALPEGVEVVDPIDLPIDALMRIERQNSLRAGLERMSERCRGLLLALYFEDPPLSYAEVSKRLKVPIGSLGPTRMRCFAKLREVLERGAQAGS
jgi:RNA polymerase sigma factor (sigma-70 family)